MGRVTRIDYGPFDLITDAPKLRESFSYTPAGLVAGRSVALRTYSNTYTTVGASFVHDNEGRRVRVNYPAGVTYSDGAWRQDPSVSYEYAFDAKGRISTMTEKNSVYGDTTVASGVSYHLAGQMTAATVFGTARTWQYNDRGQLAREAAAGMMDFTYTFDAAQNDGRAKTRDDAISGETVTYLYDKLGRLSSATATGAGVAWSQSFTHDGFGNLTQLTGSGTNLSLTVNDRNQITSGGASYDANGNRQSINGHTLGYDFENRLTSVTNVLFNDPTYQSYGAETYGYSVRGERLLVEHSPSGGSTPPSREVRLYDPAGGLMGAYTFAPTCEAPCMPSFYVIEKHEKRRVYFAGRLVKVGTQIVATDRLGSVIALREQAYPNPVTRYRYYPYGEAIGTQEWDKPQFATYTRDGSSGLDDAMNRQYDRMWGRFTSPDPYQASGGPADPGSWNRYAYVGGDPVNSADPSGLLPISIWTITNCTAYYALVGESWRTVNICSQQIVVFAYPNAPADAQTAWFNPYNQRIRELASAAELAYAALASPSCSGLFNRTGAGLAPTELLKALLKGDSEYGRVDFDDIPQAFFGVTNGIVSAPGDPPAVLITLNTSIVGGWSRTSRMGRASGLLHELGHAYERLWGPESTLVQPDSPERPDISQENQTLIEKNCFGGKP